MVERHPVQKFKVKTVEPTTQNCNRTSIRLKVQTQGSNFEIFGLEHVDGTYDDALKRWFELEKIEMAQKMKSKKIERSQFLTAKLQT